HRALDGAKQRANADSHGRRRSRVTAVLAGRSTVAARREQLQYGRALLRIGRIGWPDDEQAVVRRKVEANTRHDMAILVADRGSNLRTAAAFDNVGISRDHYRDEAADLDVEELRPEPEGRY